MYLSKNYRQIIKNIGLGALAIGVLLAPGLAALYPKKDYRAKYRLKKVIKKLEEKDVIYLSGDKVTLTKKGKQLLQEIYVNEIVLDIPDHWDKTWHLVCYDIPENKKMKRDYFRSKLIDLGFYVIQDSLWVYPYKCKEEIAVLSQSLGISPYVAYLNTDYLPQQKKLEKHFRL